MHSDKIGILITARLGSSRLPDKHIQNLGGITPIALLIRRLKQCGYPIVISTSIEDANKHFSQVANEEGVKVFFGSPSNIPLRHLQTCEAFDFDFALSVDGDDVLTAPEAINVVAENFLNSLDFTKYFYTKGYPFGMNCGGYSKSYLTTVLKNHESSTLETGWGRIFPKESYFEINVRSKNYDNWRLSLDYPEDFEMFKAIWNLIGVHIFTMPTSEILKKFEEKEIFKINQSVIEKYWSNFNTEMHREKNNE